MLQILLTWFFYILFFITPFAWNSNNFELFEYNKMMTVYALTVIIVAVWLIKMINAKKLLIKRTPLDIPLLLFLLANVISTIFSVDVHTSIWGYYSRSNGGLLSIITYTTLYYALVSNFESNDAIKFLKAALFAAVPISLWAIWEHFGVSLSCVILTGDYNASCWVQDVQARVFATLGQPNWLAAYLAMLIFPAIYFILTAKSNLGKTCYLLFVTCLYLAFTFTYSRGATLGLLAGLAILGAVLLLLFLRRHLPGAQLKISVGVLAGLLIVNLFFGSALTNFKLLSKFAGPERPSISLSKNLPSGTQLENGGTESGQIRLIVWKGALEIFKHYPIFGSGVETFAYTYYNFRPVEHNLVSEWDFLYNKAHNEYLNYLATTGLLGFLSYIALIATFIIWSIKYLVSTIKKGSLSSEHLILIALLSGYISYLVQNFFSFSVVIIALFFYLFPGLAFLQTEAQKNLKLPFKFNWFFSRDFYPKFTIFIVCLVAAVLLIKLIVFWNADTLYAKGSQANEQGNPGRAFNYLVEAVSQNPGEQNYRSELAYAAAGASVALADTDATTSAELKEKALKKTQEVLTTNPNNVSLWRTAIRSYFLLATVDKSYYQKTLEALDQTIKLAPTDPKLPYNKALILGQMGKNQEAVEALKKTVELKPNYRDAHFALGTFYQQLKDDKQAKEEMNIVLKLIPNDQDALAKLQEWEKGTNQ